MGLPKLDEQGRVNLETIMDLMYKQIWAFAEYMNDTDGKVETWKYMDFCLYAWREGFKRMAKEKKWKTKLHECSTCNTGTEWCLKNYPKRKGRFICESCFKSMGLVALNLPYDPKSC